MSENSYDAGDEVQYKTKKSRQQLINERDEAYLKAVLSTYEGRSVIWNILATCEIYSDCFTGDNRTFYNEGRRKVGLDLILAIETVEPHIMAVIRDEAVERKLKDHG